MVSSDMGTSICCDGTMAAPILRLATVMDQGASVPVSTPEGPASDLRFCAGLSSIKALAHWHCRQLILRDGDGFYLIDQRLSATKMELPLISRSLVAVREDWR